MSEALAPRPARRRRKHCFVLLFAIAVGVIVLDQLLKVCESCKPSAANATSSSSCEIAAQACVNSGFDQLTAWIAENVFVGSIVLALVLACGAMVLIPASVLTVASGAAFARALGLGTGVLVGSIVVWLGFSIGALCAFILSRYLLHEVVQRHVLHRWKITSALDAAMKSDGLKVICLLRLSNFPDPVLNYVIAATSATFRDYALACFAMVPGDVAYVYLGAALADAAAGTDRTESTRIVQTVLLIFAAVATVLVVIAISVYVRKHLRRLDRWHEESADIVDVVIGHGESTTYTVTLHTVETVTSAS